MFPASVTNAAEVGPGISGRCCEQGSVPVDKIRRSMRRCLKMTDSDGDAEGNGGIAVRGS